MKYTKENLEKYVKDCDTISDLVRKINGTTTAGPSSINRVSKKLKEYQIDTSHFLGKRKAIKYLDHSTKDYNLVLVHNEDLIVRVKRATLLNAIKNENTLEYICQICKNTGIYNLKPLILQIDHIDGNWKNNLITNLRFLCPNCHSQTENYGFTGQLKY